MSLVSMDPQGIHVSALLGLLIIKANVLLSWIASGLG